MHCAVKEPKKVMKIVIVMYNFEQRKVRIIFKIEYFFTLFLEQI